MIMESTELATKRQIEDVIILRNESVKKYQEVLDSINSIETNLKTLGEYLMPIQSYRSLDDIEKFKKTLDANLWEYCFDKLGIFMVMNSENIDKLRNEIKTNTPELTAENIETTITKLYDNRAKYFIEGVIETFRGLSVDHKTNTNEKFKIPDKCIIKYLIDAQWSRGRRLNYTRENILADIDRTFCILDKKEFKERQAICETNNKLQNNETYENDYFELKGYNNGNAHIRFKRADLLDKANQLIAEYYGNALK